MTTTASPFAAMAFAATLLLASCSNSSEPAPLTPAASATELNDVAGSGMEEQTQEMELQFDQANDVSAVQGDVKLNPAHGEPGHDCAVPVGAPLDGSGSNGTAITIPEPSAAPVASPVTSPVTSPITSPVTSPAMGTGMLNPAHGEPGHDCAVPVGSPLPG